MTTKELVEKLRRPMFNYTQAMHGDHYFKNNPGLKKGAHTKRERALNEIDSLVFEYVKSKGYELT